MRLNYEGRKRSVSRPSLVTRLQQAFDTDGRSGDADVLEELSTHATAAYDSVRAEVYKPDVLADEMQPVLRYAASLPTRLTFPPGESGSHAFHNLAMESAF